MNRAFISLAFLVLPSLTLTAAEPIGPPQKVVYDVPMGPMGPILPGYFHPDPLAHWELVAIDQQGYYKPRVMLYPQPHYLYNGKAYRYLPTRPRDLSNVPTPR